LGNQQMIKNGQSMELLKKAIDYELRQHDERRIPHQMYFHIARTYHAMNQQQEAVNTTTKQ